MAVGGMVGGGIFSTLGVVIAIAGAWTWLSFLVAGLIALAAGYSYVRLAAKYGESGGAFTFLRRMRADGFAGSLAWVLIVGYVLTNAVYAFTFGAYLGEVLGWGAVGTRGGGGDCRRVRCAESARRRGRDGGRDHPRVVQAGGVDCGSLAGVSRVGSQPC